MGDKGFGPAGPLHGDLPLPADARLHGVGEGGLAEGFAAAAAGGVLHPGHAPLGGGGEEGHLAGGQLPDGQQPAGEVGVRLPGHRGVDQEEGLPPGIDHLKRQLHRYRAFRGRPGPERPGKPHRIWHYCSIKPLWGKALSGIPTKSSDKNLRNLYKLGVFNRGRIMI